MSFLVFEGLDGSGKSTLIKALTGELSSRSINYLVTREPGGSHLGDAIRKLLLQRGEDVEVPTPRTEILLYEAIRSQHVEWTIKPFLQKKNHWVICDRFTASSLAFQSGGRGLAIEDVQWLNDFATGGLSPDLNVFLDIPVEAIQSRCSHRHQKEGIQPDRFEVEDVSFHRKVRQAYIQQIERESHKWLVLDATTSTTNMKQTLMNELIKKKWLPPAD